MPDKNCGGAALSAYLYIAKMRILTSLAYRFEVFVSVGSNLVLMLATVFLWKAAYKGVDVVNGLNENQMITYAIVSVLLSSLFQCDVQNIINNRIREGEIAIDFMRPVNLFGCYLGEDAGSAVSSLVNRMLPLLVISLLFFHMVTPSHAVSWVLFMVSCVFSFGILWLLSALIGLTAFWVMELGNMGIVKDTIVRIFSGSLVPLWFFPEGVQNVSRYLPFQYTYQTPLGIFIGRLDTAQALQAMLVQGIWIGVLLLLLHWVWSRARKNVLVQGG
jgi:ABC-2 type transport system permease protein